MTTKMILFSALMLLIGIAIGAMRPWERSRIILPSPVETPSTAKCGIENCHGMDITCGNKPAEVCTEMYALGDRCRQFAQCGVVSGTCQQIENPKFSACKSCVQNCLEKYPDDPQQQFSCESSCGE